MRPGRVVAVSLLLAVPGAPAAVADAPRKPAPACHQPLRDPAGDTLLGPAGSEFEELDIVAGDVFRRKDEVVAVLVLAGDVRTDEPTAALGYRWLMGASLNGVDYQFALQTAAGAEPRAGAEVGNAERPVTFEIKGRTITWRISRADLPDLQRPDKPTFVQLRATTGLAGGTMDSATGVSRPPRGCKPKK